MCEKWNRRKSQSETVIKENKGGKGNLKRKKEGMFKRSGNRAASGHQKMYQRVQQYL